MIMLYILCLLAAADPPHGSCWLGAAIAKTYDDPFLKIEEKRKINLLIKN
jgi:hypothetical protein